MATIRDELRPLDSLKPHSRNYNRHAEKMVGSLADAMRVVAFTAPIICREDGTILGGHARRLALLKLRAESYPEPAGVSPGWQVPCRVVQCSQAEELKVLTTDNPDPAQIDYDTGALAALLTDLQQHDSLAGTWYDTERLDALLGELVGGGVLDGDKEAPEEFQEYDETIPVEHVCPRCGYQFSGGKAAVPGADDGGD
ncbi:MAG: hypothetical protein Q7R40_00990 [Phaeospirillum sp.]|nr:hypothetical protein [Phaeospirillum sp.]